MEVVHDDRSLPGHQCLKVFFFLLQRNKLLQEFERVPSESFLRMLVFKLIKHQVAKVITWGGGNGTTGVKEFHHGGLMEDMVESPREEQIKAYVALQAWLRMPATVTRKQEVVSSSPTNVIFWTLGSNTLSMLIQGFYVHW